MLKIAGCFLVIYASFMIGHAVGQYHGRMVRELEEILLFIRIIKGQIAYAGTELPELMADSADRLNGTVKIWNWWRISLKTDMRERRAETAEYADCQILLVY